MMDGRGLWAVIGKLRARRGGWAWRIATVVDCQGGECLGDLIEAADGCSTA
ncbi:hypothetical protein [Paludibaculum fermentans]|uniref:hypothetical protein n=1 Tax=Paludibaculum fermentans TaxID=1473598 RepID=UPI003EB90D34